MYSFVCVGVTTPSMEGGVTTTRRTDFSNIGTFRKNTIKYPSSTAITADIGNGNYQCSSASDDIGQYRPDIAVLPG